MTLASAAGRDPVSRPADQPSADLARRLRRAERRQRLSALMLVLPLLLFLLVTFVAPIAGMLWRSVDDPELAQVLPRTVSALEGWDRKGLPPDAAYDALARDLREAREAGTVATAAKRLNYDLENGRSLVMSTARALSRAAPDAPARATLVEADPRWGERETWSALHRARGPLTDFYLLAALDMERDADGAIVRSPPESSLYLAVLARTFEISLGVTVLCLVMGYPVAYLLATLPARRSNLLMIFVLLPFWTSLLVRTAAWVVLLQTQGVVNDLLMALSLVEEPLALIYNRVGVYVAMTHVLLPFMILPLYSVMKSISPAHVRAAVSLGATPFTAFRRVYVPQTLPGVAAGCLLVFIMALGYYITPALVGGAGDQMISYFIAFYTTDTVNWGMASALGAVLLTATLVLAAVYARVVRSPIQPGSRR